MIERRQFLARLGIATGLGVSAVALPVVAAPAAALLTTPSRRRTLPAVRSGDRITAQSWNVLIERVNELSKDTP